MAGDNRSKASRYVSFTGIGLALARGLSQVFLQSNSVSGIIILSAVFIGSVSSGIGALAGLVSGTLTAMFLGYKSQDIAAGLYGYNGALVGIALFTLFEPGWTGFVSILAGGSISTVVMNLWVKRGTSAYTFPFVVTTWALLGLFSLVGITTAPPAPVQNANLLTGIARGFGQVMFQPKLLTGMLFAAAILISSRPAALFALIGSLVGYLGGLAVGASTELLGIGLFGFNALLCGIAFADFSYRSVLKATGGVILAVLLHWIFLLLKLPPLTFPFVLSTWIVSKLCTGLASESAA